MSGVTALPQPEPGQVETIRARLAQVRARIDAAVARRGPGPEVTLVAVSKRHPPSAIAAALAAGQREFGENYAQELRDKRRAFEGAPDDASPRWHYIGALQSNKVKYVVGASVVETVDRATIVDAIERRAAGHAHIQDILVQVNVAGEDGKAGAAPGDVPALLDHIAQAQHVQCRGLMLIPPLGDAEATRPHFAALRRLARDLANTSRPGISLDALSMGMSADFEVAIEEGATIVRVGTAIFGPRS